MCSARANLVSTSWRPGFWISPSTRHCSAGRGGPRRDARRRAGIAGVSAAVRQHGPGRRDAVVPGHARRGGDDARFAPGLARPALAGRNRRGATRHAQRLAAGIFLLPGCGVPRRETVLRLQDDGDDPGDLSVGDRVVCSPVRAERDLRGACDSSLARAAAFPAGAPSALPRSRSRCCSDCRSGRCSAPSS